VRCLAVIKDRLPVSGTTSRPKTKDVGKKVKQPKTFSSGNVFPFRAAGSYNNAEHFTCGKRCFFEQWVTTLPVIET